ncbi:MAG: choice-of-anchor D domain-containing protein [Candidatus Kapaibacterium sp.]
MSVYIEIIAPHDAYGNFGPDGFSMNNSSSTLTIELVNPDDADKLTFSPAVVSWGGRMISTHVFVNPDVEPNSWDWELLDPEFRIPFRVNVNGSLSNVDTIYILQPFHLGDISASNQNVFGNPPEMGKRSPRGAMIIDSAILNNIPYTITDTDYDASHEGNQAFLPFILLSKGGITGSGPNSEIRGQFPNQIQHAGPGGGGGGGRFCDYALFGGNGDDGGNGFTGGGKGGRNNVISGGGNYRSIGTGTGSGGTSLNGIPGGTAPWYEASGGGTGHPFGTSGEGCADGNNCSPIGGFGAGSGFSQNQAGGGGGYGTDGIGSSPDNYGRAHGNNMVVPIAGGSGGASGNPQEPNECSGSGGGGGGAIRVYSRVTIADLKISANGKDGGNGVNGSHGGGGSGGHVGVHTKLGMDNMIIEAAGGRFGGAGRLRWDTPAFNSVAAPANGETLYRSITTDTTRFGFRRDTITGSKSGSNTDIYIYMKPESGDWRELSGVENTGVNSWRIPVDLMPESDSLFYFVAMEEVADPSSDEYMMEPSRVMSQAAANIVRINNLPEIYTDTLREMRLPNCPGTTYRDTVLIENIGQHPLRVDFHEAYWTENLNDFELISPNAMTTIPPGEGVQTIVQFTVDASHSGTVTGVLNIPNDDSWHDNDPVQIRYNVIIEELSFYIGERDEQIEIDTLHVFLCPEDTVEAIGDLEIAVRNTGEIPFNIVSPPVDDAEANIITEWVDEFIPVEAKHHGMVRYNVILPLGHHYRKLIYYAEECPEIRDTVIVHFWVRNRSVDISVAGDLTDIKVGHSATISLTVENTGDIDLRWGAMPVDAPLYQIDGPRWPMQTELLPQGEQGIAVFEFRPTEVGEWNDSIHIWLEDWNWGGCATAESVPITANSVQAQVVINKDQIDFGRRARCQLREDSVWVINPPESTAPFRILSEQITGAGAANYLLPQNVAPVTLNPGDTVVYFIKFDPSIGPEGAKYAQLEIRTDDDSEDSLVVVDLTGFVEDIDITIDPDPVEFGFEPIGQIATEVVTLTNNSRLEWRILRIESDNPIISVNPTSGVLTANGGDADFTVSADLATEGEFVAELTFYFNLPCPDTLRVNVHGEGLRGEAGVSDTLDFGMVPYCQTITDSVRVSNIGATTIRIDGMTIEGPDANMFRFETLGAFPVSLDPDSIYYKRIIFNPDGNAPAGIYTAECRTSIFVNGETSEETTVLTGEIRRGLAADPGELDFGGVLPGQSTARLALLESLADWDVDLESFWFAKSVTPFSVEPTDPQGITIPAGEDFDILVHFQPPDVGDYNDTLFVVFSDGGCPDTIKIPLMGRGRPAKTLTFILPEVVADPRDKNFPVPIFVRSDSDESTEISNISATISIENGSLYNPKDMTGGNIFAMGRTLGERLVVEFKVNGPTTVAGDSTILAVINGSAMLGSSTSTTMTWLAAEFEHGGDIYMSDFEDGKFSIEVCEQGGPRLLDYVTLSKLAISPNPVAGTADIDINAAETGNYELRLVNICGMNLLLDSWHKSLNDPSERRYVLNSAEFSSGVYSLILKTPTEFVVKQIIVVK